MKPRGVALVVVLMSGVIAAALWFRPDPLDRAAPAPGVAERAADVDRPLLLDAPVASRTQLAPEPAGADEPEADVDQGPEPTHLGEEPCRLRGTLLDAETSSPLAGYRVELLAVFDRAAERRAAATDEEGVFELAIEPGEYLVFHRAEPGDGPRSLTRDVAPSRFELVRGAPGTAVEQTFLARKPPGMLEVEVGYADGSPAANAAVVFACTMDEQPLADTGNRTNAEGRVMLGVWDPREFTDGRLTARDEDGNVSDVLPVEAPLLPGVRRLVLRPGGELEVRVLEADGSPVAGRRALLSGEAALGPRFYRETDADGRLRFEALSTGSYLLSIRIPDRGTWERRTLELVRGEKRWLEVVLAEPDEPLAVGGIVLDEEGQPLPGAELALAQDGREAGTVRTGDDGEFRFRAEPSERVWIGANVLEQGDRYEPAEADVPFGTEFVVFRRTARAIERTFEVEVHDRTTGEELEHFVATIDRGPGTEAWSDSYAPRRRFVLRLLPDARWRVKSHGYLTHELNLSEALDALEEGERLRVGLEPGLDHAFRVLDADTLQPVGDVSLRSETAGEARSDADGWVRLRSDHWSVYRVTKDGYAPDEWDPDDEVLWGRGPFLLAR